MTPEERLEVYYQTPEWRRTSAIIGAILGLILGLLFWWLSPFHMASMAYLLIMLALAITNGTVSYFLKIRKMTPFEHVLIRLLVLLGILRNMNAS